MTGEPRSDSTAAGGAPRNVTALLADVLACAPVEELLRVDAGLEGAWTESARTLWSRGDGLSGAEAFHLRDRTSLPCLELMFTDGWIGVRCSVRRRDSNVLDEALARHFIATIERRLSRAANRTSLRFI
jgi:hypothetical protein